MRTSRINYSRIFIVSVFFMLIFGCKKDDPIPPNNNNNNPVDTFNKDTISPLSFSKVNTSSVWDVPRLICAANNGEFYGLANFNTQIKVMRQGNLHWSTAWSFGAQLYNPGFASGKDGSIMTISGNGGNLWIATPSNYNMFVTKNPTGIDLSKTWSKFFIESSVSGTIYVYAHEIYNDTTARFYVSTNGGSTFVEKNLPPDFQNFASILEEGRELYAGPNNDIYLTTNTKVYRSTDDGTSWSTIYTTNFPDHFRGLYIKTDGTFFINKGSYLFRASNSSSSLMQLDLSYPTKIIAGQLPNGDLIADTQRSPDNGVTWYPIGNVPTNQLVVGTDRILAASSFKTYALDFDATEWRFSGYPHGECKVYKEYGHIRVFADNGGINQGSIIYLSLDYGTSWRKAYEFNVERVEDIVWMDAFNQFAVVTTLKKFLTFDPIMSAPTYSQPFPEQPRCLHWDTEKATLFLGLGEDPSTGGLTGRVWAKNTLGTYWKESRMPNNSEGYIQAFLRDGDMLYSFYQNYQGSTQMAKVYMPNFNFSSTDWQGAVKPLSFNSVIPDYKVLSVVKSPLNNTFLYLKTSNIIFAERPINKDNDKEVFIMNTLTQDAQLGDAHDMSIDEDGYLYLMTENGLFKSDTPVRWD